MKSKKILILCDKNSDRSQASDKIAEKITELGGQCLFLGYADLISKKSILTLNYHRRKVRMILHHGTKKINLKSEIKSVLYLVQKIPSLGKRRRLKKDERRFFRDEWETFMQGVWLLLKDRLWLNPYPNYFVYQEKCYQLHLAQKVGLKIPYTFISTSLKEADYKFKSIPHEIIYKPFTQRFFNRKEKSGKKVSYHLYTNIIKKTDLKKEPVLSTPNIFQVYIPKKVEIRITVVGTAFFAAEIHSQKSKLSRIDWRRYDLSHTPYYRHNLPKDIEKKCIRLVQKMGLTYATIDMILTPQGEYVFLELNPYGLYQWVEDLTGLPISENIARMLMEGSVHYHARK